ncbi:hypothetical protein [Plantibacter sp. CFBP 8775]|uniref:hypothetical protein n=1 Tax=Plantibacter sp. CFBP 8775 TaxID=2774038 RepID=UPI0017848026|nr:hypothetical protein [Plantibacter sp. CFBP 8775]MBD8104739.1 hypothetical protein [Plantibacter sp. CFBP 8775]
MGNRGEVSPGKLPRGQQRVRLIVVVLAGAGALVALAAALSPDIMNALYSTGAPVFVASNAAKFGDLSVLLLTYVFLALGRYSDSKFIIGWIGWILLLGAWWMGVMGIPRAGTFALLLAVASVVFAEVRDKDKVWIWTDVPAQTSVQSQGASPTAPSAPVTPSGAADTVTE